MQTVAIISALDEEAAHIADSLDNMTVTERASLSVARGTLTTDAGEELDVAVTVGGMGLVNAAATTQFLIDLVHPEAVIFSGIAGNLNKSLHINDIVLGKTLRYLDTDIALIAESAPGLPMPMPWMANAACLRCSRRPSSSPIPAPMCSSRMRRPLNVA